MKSILSIVCLAIGGIVVEPTAAHLKRSTCGTSIAIEQAPFYASIIEYGRHICSGAFITTKHVLTAAHCLVDSFGSRIYGLEVVSGTDKKYVGGDLHQIHDIAIPLEFDWHYATNDIGVIILSVHVKWSINRNFVTLPKEQLVYDETAIFIPFDTAEQTDLCPLHQMELAMYPINICPEFQPDYTTFSNKICAVAGVNQTTQPGDSGGPLIYKRKIVGILSKRYLEAPRLSIFTNVYEFSAFIDKAKMI